MRKPPPNSKFTEEQVIAIRQDVASGMKYLDVAQKHGITRFNVISISLGRVYKWAGGPISKPRKNRHSKAAIKHAIEALANGTMTYSEVSKLHNVPPKIIGEYFRKQDKFVYQNHLRAIKFRRKLWSRKLTREQILIAREAFKKGGSRWGSERLAKQFGVSHSVLSRAARGLHYRDI